MTRVWNFSPGPAALPESVLATAAAEMTDYGGLGYSVLEMSHRSAAFGSILSEAISDLRALLSIPDHYRVLFLTGVLLFSITFVVNLTADLVIRGIRRK